MMMYNCQPHAFTSVYRIKLQTDLNLQRHYASWSASKEVDTHKNDLRYVKR
jgi:hypothetical protein